MKTLYTNAVIYTGGRFAAGEFAVEGGRIVPVAGAAPDRTVDLGGRHVIPGLVDVHVHLREPGFSQKETIASGTAAAARGGYTTVCSMPNLNPAPDAPDTLRAQAEIIRRDAVVRVVPYGCITMGQRGAGELVDFAALAPDVVGFSDDGRGVQGAGMLRRCMDYGKMFGKVFMSHCQDEDLVGHGQINEGKVSTRLALEGWPAAGEELQIARDIEIAKLTGAKLHIQHISTAHGLEIVRAGKAAGVQVTCEATPHHMFLTENDLDETYNTSLKVNPPLRTDEDAEAIRQGVIDGTVDAIVTDHAPHTPWEKAREFELAPFGMIGLETSLSLVLTELVNTGKMSVGRMVELMAIKPREILGLDQVQVKAGSVADLTVFDPAVTWTVGEDGYESRDENSGFAGRTLTGRATDVFVGGKQTLADGCIC